MPPLSNPKHEIVAQNVASGKSYEESMLLAGYAPNTARHNMVRLVSNVGVSARIAEIQQAMVNAKLVTAAKLHERWSEMFEADIGDILTTAGTFKPVMEWPKVWRQMLSGVDVKELFERSKDGGESSWDKIGEVIKLKFVGVKDLGDMLGRHVAVDAFVKQQRNDTHMHIHLSGQIDAAISEGRQRALARNVTRELPSTTTCSDSPSESDSTPSIIDVTPTKSE